MGKTKRMDEVKQILQTYLETNSIKATCRRLNVSKNTVKVYLRAAQRYDEDIGKLLCLDNNSFMNAIYPGKENQKEAKRKTVFDSKISYWIKELRRVGVTRRLLWEEYREEHPDGYSYGHFCEHFSRAFGRRDLTLSMTHEVGKVMQVDFAGKKLSWVDISSGEIHSSEVLIAVFPHSQYTFAIALPSQKMEDFVNGLNQALLYFGGLPKVILSDNLKSFVTRSDRYEPKFNDLCVQLAAYYQLDLQATRVRRPKDKASVENAVANSYRGIYAPLRNETFHSLEELNQAIQGQLEVLNRKSYQQKQGSRHDVFHSFELPEMKELPSDLFEIKRTKTAKVQRNYHVYLGEDKVYFSVPYQHARKKSTINYTSKTIEIYVDNERVAIHERPRATGYQQHVTKLDHMPKSHQEWKKTQGYNAAYFIKEASKIGPYTQQAIRDILLSRFHESQSYNSCRGVLSLAKRYTASRLENAAGRCLEAGKVSYNMLKRVLDHNLDMEKNQVEIKLPLHKNIRGPQAYQ